MIKKLMYAVALTAILAVSCGKSTPADESGDRGGNTPGDTEEQTEYGDEGVYSETFNGYTGGIKSDYAAVESFTSLATGVEWTLTCGCINQTTDQAVFEGGNCFTLGGKSGKADDGQSVLSTGILQDGITALEFDYVANKDKKLEIIVESNGSKVWSSGTLELKDNGADNPKKPVHLSFSGITNAPKDAVLRFVNVSELRRISIGNISWTNATGEGGNGRLFDGGGESGEGGEGEGGKDETRNVACASVTAEYYGDFYESGTENWCITMEDRSGNEMIMVEFFTALGAKTPEGTFNIDITESMAEGTAFAGMVDEDGYVYPTCYVNMSTQEYVLASSGTLTVTRSGESYTVNAEFKDLTGMRIYSSYTGNITIKEGEVEDDGGDSGEGGGSQGGDSSDDDTTLKGNVTVTGIDYAEAESWGDIYSLGTQDWLLYLENPAGEYLTVEFFTELSATTPEGKFTVDLDYSGAKNTMWEGYLDGEYVSPIYYSTATEDYAYAVSGDMTIAKSGDGYSIRIALKDEKGHTFGTEYTGKLEITQGQLQSSSRSLRTAPRHHKAFKAAKTVLRKAKVRRHGKKIAA